MGEKQIDAIPLLSFLLIGMLHNIKHWSNKTTLRKCLFHLLRPAYTTKVSGTCFKYKAIFDLFLKQKIKGSLWNLCAVCAGL